MERNTYESFPQLVIQYERLVYTVCFQLVRDAAAAEDLTQETFLSAYPVSYTHLAAPSITG